MIMASEGVAPCRDEDACSADRSRLPVVVELRRCLCTHWQRAPRPGEVSLDELERAFLETAAESSGEIVLKIPQQNRRLSQ